MPSPKSAAKAERLLNLVIALLNSERYRDVSWIRTRVEGYRDASSDEAFFRMFERDKVELRDLGIPLQTSAEGGYRIPRGEFALPEISFTAGEKAALALAGRVWETSVLGGAGTGALRKLADASGDRIDASRLSLQPRVRTSDPAFGPIYEAVKQKQAVTFPYRKGNAADVTVRHLQPWGLVSWRGRWYIVGRDTDRGEQRTFRLSRIAGPVKAVGRPGTVRVPDGVDFLAAVARVESATDHRVALIQLATSAGAGLRRRGAVLADAESTASDQPAKAMPPGFERLQIPLDHLWDTARAIASLGPDVLVEAPDDLRDAVVRLLRGALEAGDSAHPAFGGDQAPDVPEAGFVDVGDRSGQ